nr:Histidine kinase [uncultured bacterium]
MDKTIGVLIVETDAGTPGMATSNDLKPSTIMSAEEEAQNFFVDRLSENVLIFDGDGYLITANEEAKQLYKKLGYQDEIIGLFYDNLTLDYYTFDYIKFRAERSSSNWFFDVETHYLQYYFTIKYSWIKNKQRLVVIIQDTTEVKKREEELVLKAVAIREIHHRVKNNLQSIVSLLETDTLTPFRITGSRFARHPRFTSRIEQILST